MKMVPVGLALRDRLGENAVRDLDDYMEEHRKAGRVDVMHAISEQLDSRFNTLDYRFKECAKREDMIVGFARVEKQIDANKVEILRWSFVFWIGQVATIAVLLSYMLK
ncbi:MAG TPA: hypothetical protein VFZ31_05520 [Vicinamibacterales bacterium]